MNPHERQKNRDRIAAALLVDPARSDRQLALDLEVDRATVRRARAALEKSKQIPRIKIVLGDDGKRRRVIFHRQGAAAGDDDPDDDEDRGFSVAQIAWLSGTQQSDANRFEAFRLRSRALYQQRDFDRVGELVTRALRAQLIDRVRADELRSWLQHGLARQLFFRGAKKAAAEMGFSRADHQRELQASWDRSTPNPDNPVTRRSRGRRGRR